MEIGNYSTVINKVNKKRSRKALLLLLIPMIAGFALMIAMPFIADISAGLGALAVILAMILIIGGVVLLVVNSSMEYKKYAKTFISDLEAEGFIPAVTLDTKRLNAGDPAMIAVDSQKRLIAIRLYSNLTERYIFPISMLTGIWSGKELSGDRVAAAFGFTINNVNFVIPLKIKTRFSFYLVAYRISYEIEQRKKKRFEEGRVSVKFKEAVEQADEWARMLLSLSARY